MNRNYWKYLKEDGVTDGGIALCTKAFLTREIESRGFKTHEKGKVGQDKIFMCEKGDNERFLLGVVINMDGGKEPSFGLDETDIPLTDEGRMMFSLKSICEEELVIGFVAYVTIQRDFESDPDNVNFYKISSVTMSLV